MYPTRDNKSQKIRDLFDAGMSIAEIARVLGIRYQYAYNVVSYHVKMKEGGWIPHDTGNRSNDRVYLSTVAIG